MGFRFRKSIKLGGLRVNLSKSGVGYSVGGKGFRYTKKAGGGTRTTASIPGTGISHVSDSSGPKAGTPKRAASIDTKEGMDVKKSQKSGCLGPIIAVLLCFSLLGSCFGGGDEDTTPTEPSETITQVESTTGAADETEPTEPVTEVTEPPTEAPTDPPTEPPTEAPTDPPETEPEGITYILNTNTHKFHYQGCSSVRDMKESNKSTYTGTRDEVIDMGYKPCGRCDP